MATASVVPTRRTLCWRSFSGAAEEIYLIEMVGHRTRVRDAGVRDQLNVQNTASRRRSATTLYWHTPLALPCHHFVRPPAASVPMPGSVPVGYRSSEIHVLTLSADSPRGFFLSGSEMWSLCLLTLQLHTRMNLDLMLGIGDVTERSPRRYLETSRLTRTRDDRVHELRRHIAIGGVHDDALRLLSHGINGRGPVNWPFRRKTPASMRQSVARVIPVP
jgi:hypothetical protein